MNTFVFMIENLTNVNHVLNYPFVQCPVVLLRGKFPVWAMSFFCFYFDNIDLIFDNIGAKTQIITRLLRLLKAPMSKLDCADSTPYEGQCLTMTGASRRRLGRHVAAVECDRLSNLR